MCIIGIILDSYVDVLLLSEIHFFSNCSWLKDSLFQQKQALEDDPDRIAKESKICWTCPKCRHAYPQKFIPRDYFCYCKKERDPKFDPWYSPHSCGEVCGKKLPGSEE